MVLPDWRRSFILTLRGLSGPKTAIAGNRYGMIAMAIAVVTTFFVAENPVVWMILAAMAAGAVVGIARARTVPMTQMPETVALMHSLVGLAAVLIAVAAIIHNNKLVELGPDLLAANGVTFHEMSKVHLFELFVGCFVGAITFTASVFAYGKWLQRNGQNHFRWLGKTGSGSDLYCNAGSRDSLLPDR